MAVATTTALLAAGLALSAGSTFAQMSNAASAKSDAKKKAEEQANQQAQMEKEAKDRQAVEEASQAQVTARAKQKSLLGPSANSRGGTLLTGPLGVPGAAAPAAPAKTLLGS